ncbi:headcase protein-like [Varroa jacobsoni]|uniref:headcase protein-like n=1 Tax=Varroa jacobsoni TaxID=62625 RepID=UPI000BF77BA0|nr:headcase protein-like [Varroa jacobsoni]
MTAVAQRVVSFAIANKTIPFGLMPTNQADPNVRTLIQAVAGRAIGGQQIVQFDTAGDCCVPTGCKAPLSTDDLSNAVRVVCTNTDCRAEYMHRECFEQWQNSLLGCLPKTAGGRNWTEKQRLQYIWSKKASNYIVKACACKCNKGQLRKDLDWIPPVADEKKKRGRKKKQNEKTVLGSSQGIVATTRVSAAAYGGQLVQVGQQQQQQQYSNRHQNNHHHQQLQHQQLINQDRMRSSSISSTGSTGCSPPMTPDQFASPIPRSPVNPFFNSSRSGNYEKLNPHSQQEVQLFSRRQDYSAFNCLPRTKINSYMIKVEDDDRSDDIRTYILTTLAQQRTTRLPCCLCHSSLEIYDQFPIVDGLMFLSPRQHSPGSVSMAAGRRDMNGISQTQYLNAVCMTCLDGDWQTLRCVSCHQKWAGSPHIIGGLYCYDVFAAQPCCEDRLRCNRCEQIIMTLSDPEKKYFFSDYSHNVACPNCRLVDFHFVKPLNIMYNFN